MDTVLLPGSLYQVKFLFDNLTIKPQSILVIGGGNEVIAVKVSNHYNTNVTLIVDEYELFINARLIIGNNKNVSVILMSYETTDFTSSYFDLVYAQASISLTNRNKIVREIVRILKPKGYLCVGELINLKDDVPKFMKDIYEASNLLPLPKNEAEKYYIQRGFKVLKYQDLSYTLEEYYTAFLNKLKKEKEKLEEEKAYYKKLFKRISHESNAYLKLGGDKYLGFYALLLEKEEI
ncbi:MAG: methyltransferase domain-containing protein [Melioribacter sp.]|nr:methyltransferase domain-containing protein [Melioribacter sp.]